MPAGFQEWVMVELVLYGGPLDDCPDDLRTSWWLEAWGRWHRDEPHGVQAGRMP